MLPKGGLNKAIKVHRVEWEVDRTLKEDIKTDIKTPNRWDSTVNNNHNKWADTNQVFTAKCTAVRFRVCPHLHRI